MLLCIWSVSTYIVYVVQTYMDILARQSHFFICLVCGLFLVMILRWESWRYFYWCFVLSVLFCLLVVCVLVEVLLLFPFCYSFLLFFHSFSTLYLLVASVYTFATLFASLYQCSLAHLLLACRLHGCSCHPWRRPCLAVDVLFSVGTIFSGVSLFFTAVTPS